MAGIYSPLRMDTLRDALQVLVEKAYYKRPEVASLGSVRVRDAAAAAVLLDVSKREAIRKGQRFSRVSNESALQHLVAASAILGFLDAVLLPALLADPSTSQPYIDSLAHCVRELRKEAAGVGGSFCTEVASLCDYAESYHKLPPVQRPTELMKAAVAKIVARVKSLLESTAVIPDKFYNF